MIPDWLGALFGVPRARTDWRFIRNSLRRCERMPLYRTLAGSVVVCRSDYARRALIDSESVLEHLPAFWQFPNGAPIPEPACAELNRWVHHSLDRHDAAEAAEIAVSRIAASSGDLHRACLLAVTESAGSILRTDVDHALRALVRSYVGELFHTVVVGTRRREHELRARALARKVAPLLAAHRDALPGVLAEDGALSGAERGELYLRAVTAFVGASAVAMAWLICALSEDDLAEVDLSGAARERIEQGPPGPVAMELLRLWPPAWQHRRRVLRDHAIGPLTALRDDDLVIPVVALHRHPAEWANPRVFDPDRWRTDPRPAAFMPFALGPRACVGGRYEIRWLTEVAGHVPTLKSLRLARLSKKPCVTAVFSPPRCEIAPG
ncbi:cytochrome P450 [Luteimonas sp. Y-2-2-4F]|nr:cytochrome P450 [Luteimonas sp. Y-2-2-4F]